MKFVRRMMGFFLVAITASILTLILTSPKAPEVESTPAPNERLESPWGVPDYNVAPKYEDAPVEHDKKFIAEVPEAVNNYDPNYDVHYAQNAKAICSSLDQGGLKYGDVFPEDDKERVGYIAVSNYCPHNL